MFIRDEAVDDASVTALEMEEDDEGVLDVITIPHAQGQLDERVEIADPDLPIMASGVRPLAHQCLGAGGHRIEIGVVTNGLRQQEPAVDLDLGLPGGRRPARRAGDLAFGWDSDAGRQRNRSDQQPGERPSATHSVSRSLESNTGVCAPGHNGAAPSLHPSSAGRRGRRDESL